VIGRHAILPDIMEFDLKARIAVNAFSAQPGTCHNFSGHRIVNAIEAPPDSRQIIPAAMFDAMVSKMHGDMTHPDGTIRPADR
jgi:hypothetical protein